MHEIHPDLLWIGNAMDVREPAGLFDVGIAAVVDVAYEESPAQLPRQLVYCRFPLNDGGGNDDWILRQVLQTTLDLLRAGTKTIVACSACMSRSPTVAAYAVGAFLDQEPEAVIARIAEVKALEIKPDLWNDMASVFGKVHRS